MTRTVDQDRNDLQIAYNALCSAMWHLEQVPSSAAVDLRRMVDKVRAELAPIAFPRDAQRDGDPHV